MRSYQFHLVIFSFRLYTFFHTFPHSKSTKSNDFTEYTASHIHATLFSRGTYIHRRRNTTTALGVAQVFLAFSRTFPSNWISFAPFIYLLQMLLLGQPSCTHKSLMASTSILIFVLPYRAHFSLPSSVPDIPRCHALPSSCHHPDQACFVSSPHLPQGLRSSAFSHVPQKWTRAIRRIFPSLALTLFIWLRRFEIA